MPNPLMYAHSGYEHGGLTLCKLGIQPSFGSKKQSLALGCHLVLGATSLIESGSYQAENIEVVPRPLKS